MFYFYGFCVFLVCLADAIMSYISPVYMQLHLGGSPLIMGLIIASSSLVGLACDYVLGKFFARRSFIFYFWATVGFGLLFPGTFLVLPPYVFTFLLGMAIWGVYYELIQFSNYHFIHRALSRQRFVWGWGILDILKGSAYFLSPLLAGVLLDQHETFPFYGALVLFVISGVVFALFLSRSRFRHSEPLPESEAPSTPHPVWRSWKLLFSRVWPLYFFLLSLSLLESLFWTIGAVYSEELHELGWWGRLFLPAFQLPTMFAGLFAHRLSLPFGKKRVALFAGLLGGAVLSLLAFQGQTPLLIGTVFVTGFCCALIWPQIEATFEDYVEVLKDSSNDMIGLQRSATSIGYVLGPAVGGLASSMIGSQYTLALFGAFFALVSIFGLLFTPRRIRMPQQQLEHLLSESVTSPKV